MDRKQALRLRSLVPPGSPWRRALARVVEWACGKLYGHDWRGASVGEARLVRKGYRDRTTNHADVRGCAICGAVEHYSRPLQRYVRKPPTLTTTIGDGDQRAGRA